jgi:hypothetical protein
MSVYSNCKIFGLRIYHFNDAGFINILFEKKYDKIMNREQMRKAYLFYSKLDNKNDIFFRVYTECSTLNINAHNNNETYMEWYPISLNMFLEQFRF